MVTLADCLPAGAELAMFADDYQQGAPLAFLLRIDGKDYALDTERFIYTMVRLYGDAPVAQAAATCLRALANDLDALAYAWRLEAHASNKRNPFL